MFVEGLETWKYPARKDTCTRIPSLSRLTSRGEVSCWICCMHEIISCSLSHRISWGSHDAEAPAISSSMYVYYYYYYYILLYLLCRKTHVALYEFAPEVASTLLASSRARALLAAAVCSFFSFALFSFLDVKSRERERGREEFKGERT